MNDNGVAESVRLSHLDGLGRAAMVDVGGKPATRRYARAWGVLELAPETLELMCGGGLAKGDVFAAARLAGIMAAKRCGELIPLCHPLPFDWAGVELVPSPSPEAGARARVFIFGEAALTGRTGIEMEALTAVAVAGLTLYDMGKAVDRGMNLGRVALLEKKGGRSGHFIAPEWAVPLAGSGGFELEADELVEWCSDTSEICFSRAGDARERIAVSGGVPPLAPLPGRVVVLGGSLLRPETVAPAGSAGRLRVVSPGRVESDGMVAVLG